MPVYFLGEILLIPMALQQVVFHSRPLLFRRTSWLNTMFLTMSLLIRLQPSDLVSWLSTPRRLAFARMITNVAVGTFATSSTLHSLHRSDPRMCPNSVARDLGLLPKCRRSKVRSQIPDRPTGPLSHRSLGV